MFNYTRTDILDLSIYSADCTAGEEEVFKAPRTLGPTEHSNILFFASGLFEYWGETIALRRREPGWCYEDANPPGVCPKGEHTLRCLESGRFFCIRHTMSDVPPTLVRHKLKTSQAVAVPQGSIALMAGADSRYTANGKTMDGVRILVAATGPVTVTADTDLVFAVVTPHADVA